MQPALHATVSSHQEITQLIEKAFGGTGIVAALTPKVDVARAKLAETVLGGMERFADQLPANWSGVTVTESGLTVPERSRFIEAQKEFARDISSHLAQGLTTVSLGWLSKNASITFHTYHAGGTGEAAAHLVAATLASHGIESKVRGTEVSFPIAAQERRALKEFKEAVNDVVVARREFLEGLTSQ